MRVAITGSTGLIGSALTRSLLADDHQVVRPAALRFALDTEELSGPVNFTAPEPLTNRQVTRALSRALHRPALAAVPAFALRAALGEFAGSITCSARVVPAALYKAGFAFAHPTIDAALDSVLRPTA
ncbi:DUF1731 domain-containing protein [Streptomyces sp. NPDC003233]